jgi:uncharacterized protein (DUF302 family)
MDVTAIDVDYSDGGRQHEPFQYLRSTALPFKEVLERLRAAIREEDVMVLQEIDPQAILARSNYVIGAMRQLLFFHPRLMARLLDADPSALLEAPLKFSVIAGREGLVHVRWQDPAPAFARYGEPALAKLGDELADLCRVIADAALNTG